RSGAAELRTAGREGESAAHGASPTDRGGRRRAPYWGAILARAGHSFLWGLALGAGGTPALQERLVLFLTLALLVLVLPVGIVIAATLWRRRGRNTSWRRLALALLLIVGGAAYPLLASITMPIVPSSSRGSDVFVPFTAPLIVLPYTHALGIGVAVGFV